MRLQDGLQNLFASIEGTGEQEAAGLMAALQQEKPGADKMQVS